MDTLKNLHSLVNIYMDSLIMAHLTYLTSLCKLGIVPDENSDESKLWASLTKLKNLVCLKDPMPVLEMLPNLVYVKLEGFPNLKVLSLDSIKRLRNIKIGKGGMPKLKRLESCQCFKLDTLPKEFSNLQELKIVTIPEKASQFRVANTHIISKIPFYFEHTHSRSKVFGSTLLQQLFSSITFNVASHTCKGRSEMTETYGLVKTEKE
ncbi:hypothetical protein CDL12_05648 [Handroanthus impetiginosus]|uniref:Uncharacterized protein n=1 Tax=Handroanthus impetiginosus TaxID=429701 RepID=A0A2G9HVW5_9LAMI|nr:hypothetical protein CDL12_05648 [Handroanthus impetiginosus]